MGDNTTQAASISYENGKTLMAAGPEALHEHVSSRVQVALGRPLPRMEVRVKHLQIKADVVVTADQDDEKSTSHHELPTIANHVKHSVHKLLAKRSVVQKTILHDFSGVFKPGTITLILGQPGSGKSSLMKALSARFPLDKHIQLDGEMTYNGVVQSKLRKRLPRFVSYVTQQDRHFPTLTVKETLAFAHQCCGGRLTEQAEKHLGNDDSQESQDALAAARAFVKHRPDVVIQQLGLENCQDTVVGDAMLRGISGGERKRVTTGEMQFGTNYVCFMDEISTGLDSAATFDIIKTQRNIAKTFQKTIVISLLQPSPEVFSLFDNVVILNDGYVMYQGPREEAVPYFSKLGFDCPARRDAADFLLDLGTAQQYPYETITSSGSRPPRTPAEFASAFRQSDHYTKVLAELSEPEDAELVNDVKTHVLPSREFHQPFWESTMTLMRRQSMITMRNTAFLKGRTIMVVVMGLLYASVFYQFDVENIQVVMGIIFAAVLFLALGQASQIPTFMSAREVFYKQRGANFFRTSSYVLSSSVSQVPLAFLETAVFGSLVYWMCGFVASVESYLLYELMLLMTNLAFAAWFFFLSAIAPDLHVAKPISMVSILFFVLFAGFVISRNSIPDYFIWIYWINPIAWCVRALAVNQYRNAEFDVCEYEGVNYCQASGKPMGEYLLQWFDVPSEKYWIGYGLLFMLFSYVLFMTLSYLTLEYKRYEGPEHVSLSGAKEDENGEDSNVGQVANVPASSNYELVSTPKSLNGTTGEVVVHVTPHHERQFDPVTVAFQDLWYSVPHPSNPKESIDLLKGISGFAKPGTMTALMGSSGAGKTTLMDVIAGRKTGGKIRGKILLNGHEATDLAIRRCTGYCEQMDIHSEAATFREALTFSAFLRQSSDVPDAKKYDTVEECLELLDMQDIADKIIRGSSTEQMKRLTIGVELAAQPSVLFLDEPTSGLDARSAKVIMDGVRKVANTGRTILCTIHQPSSEVFGVFDSLLLLKRGGETVFFGELGSNCHELIEYFESIPDVPKLTQGYNPATWMLEVIGAGVGNTSGQGVNFVDMFVESAHKQRLDMELNQEGVSYPSPTLKKLEFGKKRAATSRVQLYFLMKRFFDMYWRTPSYNWTRFVISLVLGVLFGLVFMNAEYNTFQGINAGVGMVFMTTIFIGIVSFNSVLPIASEERASFYRERASQTYNALWYFVGTTLVEIPYVVGATFLFTAVFYPTVGFTGVARFVWYWLILSLHVLMQTYFGQLLAFAMPSVEVAAIMGVLLNSIFFLFMGFNPPAAELPSGYRWLYHITPPKYSLAMLVSMMFGQCTDGSEVGCQAMENAPLSVGSANVKQYIENVFEMKYDDMWLNLAVVIGCTVLFRVLALLALRYVNHQKR